MYAGSPLRERRAWVVTSYFMLAASLYFVDSIHMAVVLLQVTYRAHTGFFCQGTNKCAQQGISPLLCLQFNVLELNLALKIKQLDDALEKTLDHLGGKHLELAMLVSIACARYESTVRMRAKHSWFPQTHGCLQPMETSADDLGQQLICMHKMEIFHTAWYGHFHQVFGPKGVLPYTP